MSKTAVPETIAGRYRVSARIGSGGMGSVVRARDEVLGRNVAVKILSFELASRPGFVERFKSEAQSAARLSHPNVVQIHDWGPTDSTYYMVMEYVRGKNLRDVLALREFLAPAQVADLMIQVLDGLDAAHSAGLVHRDIKPENVLLTIDGRAKVADFGIARPMEGRPTAQLLGTVAYVAPEHARGESVDGRSDLYSAGCVMYELLTGHLPYEGDAAQILNHHLTSRVPKPSAERPETEPLDEIVERATHPEPAMRYATAGEMKEALQAARARLPQAPPLSELSVELTGEISSASVDTGVVAQPKKARPKWPMIAGGALIALVILGFVLWPVEVPRVQGLSEVAAKEKLVAAGFQVESRYSFGDEKPGTVIGTDPAELSKERRGSRVILQVSRGPAVADLMDLAGRPLEDAKSLIKSSGLVVGEVTEKFDRVMEGIVLSQSPAPGQVRKGTPVNLVVSKGPEMLPVPDVMGKAFDEAKKILEDAGFSVKREDVFNDAPPNTVLAQSPKGGEKAGRESAVALQVSRGPEPFAMPDVRGKGCSQAKGELEALGLVVMVSSRSGGCTTNKVLEQDPLPGAKVKKGQEVTLFVS